MKRTTADTNLFIHAADPDSPHHAKAREFFADACVERDDHEFVLCELVLVELYMLLRNAAVFAKPGLPGSRKSLSRTPLISDLVDILSDSIRLRTDFFPIYLITD